jgi:hypothetical protein
MLLGAFASGHFRIKGVYRKEVREARNGLGEQDLKLGAKQL